MAASNSSKKFCFICQKQFKSDVALKRHEAFHNRRKGFKCNICDNVFISKKFLLKHKASHKVDKNTHKVQFQVKRCTSDKTKAIVLQRTATPAAFDISTHVEAERPQDVKILKSVNVWNCGICRTSYPSNEVLCIHLGIGKKRRHLCAYCFKCFTCAQQYADHVITHDAKVIICHVCGGSLKTQELFKQHIEQHAVVKLVNPDSDESMSDKMCSKQEVNRTQTCDICGKIYKDVYSFTRHLKQHSQQAQEKPTCSICNITFKSTSNLKRHMRKHSQTKDFKCKICGKEFYRPDYLAVHEKSHSNTKSHFCDICGDGFSSLNNLRSHTLNHAKKFHHKCTYCEEEKLFIGKLQLWKHQERVHSEHLLYHQCKECNVRFATGRRLDRHNKITHTPPSPKPPAEVAEKEKEVVRLIKKISRSSKIACEQNMDIIGLENQARSSKWVSSDAQIVEMRNSCEAATTEPERGDETGSTKSHTCTYCEKPFITLAEVRKHIQKEHSEKQCTCYICEKTFLSEHNLIEHLDKYHDDVKVKNCPLCEMKVETKLYEHMKKEHNDARDYKCEICQKTFFRKTELNSHVRQHTRERPRALSCEVCGSSFYSTSNLLRHTYLHYSTKEFICHICGKSYNCKNYLQIHIKRNHNADPNLRFKCDICWKEFTNDTNLKRHMNIHMGINAHICEVCGKSVSRAHDLKRHKTTHDRSTSYPCDKCGKIYAHQQSLKKHMESHDRKKMQCENCERTFKQMKAYEKHISSCVGKKIKMAADNENNENIHVNNR